MTWRVVLIGVMTMGLSGETAKGTFEVKLAPLEGAVIGRMLIDKTFAGDLAGTSIGEMLAMEKVTGTLAGRTGTFVLRHSGTMAGGKQELSVTVVPDSGNTLPAY